MTIQVPMEFDALKSAEIQVIYSSGGMRVVLLPYDDPAEPATYVFEVRRGDRAGGTGWHEVLVASRGNGETVRQIAKNPAGLVAFLLTEMLGIEPR